MTTENISENVEKQTAEEAQAAVETAAETVAEPVEVSVEDALRAELEDAKLRAEEMKNIAQRVQADFENFRKRNNDAVAEARKDGENSMLSAILTVADSFERALTQIEDATAKEGVAQIYKQLTGFFTAKGVEEIEAEGQEFNPVYHNAVMTVDDPDNAGKIVEVLMKGYKRGNKVLRLPVVKVAK